MEALSKRLESGGGDELAPTLKELGMEDYSFAAVRDTYPEAFGQRAA